MYGQASIGQKAYNFCYMPGLLCSVQGSSVEFIPTFMMKFIFQDQSVHTTNLKPCALSAGAQYRVKDAFVPMLLFEYDMYALGVSYDLNLSKLSPVSKMKGGLEIALRFNWNPGYGKMLGGSYNRPTYKL